MLLKLLLFRMGPVVSLRFCKNRNQMKLAVCAMACLYLFSFFLLLRKLIFEGAWDVLLRIPAALLPHYLCYGFALWLLFRCLFFAWSDRVFKRIYRLSFLGVLLGVLAEAFVNPKILQFFCKVLK